ncbi:MAG: hypothetical protein WC222_08710 [Parachlamydiales bacterium]|jgi:hypothetical protein
MRKVAIFLICCCLLSWGGYALYHHIYFRYLLTDLTLAYDLKDNWKTQRVPYHLHDILQQKFTYLDQGAQSYAFASEDGKYVLKIFHYKHFNKPSKRAKLLIGLQGYATGYEKIPKESGIIYQQLKPGVGPEEVVIVTDRLGWEHSIQLKDVRYVLQKRVTLVSERLKDPAFRKKLFDFVEKERLIGIYDLDYGLSHNIGFIGEDLYHIDLGKLTYNPAFCQSDEFAAHITKIEKRLAAKGF